MPASRLAATAPGAVDALTGTFEQAFREAHGSGAQARAQPPGGLVAPHAAAPPHFAAPPHAVSGHAPAPGGARSPELHAALHAFMHTPAHAPVRLAAASAAAHLSIPEKVQIRDRSTILARHLFADRGDAYADAQAGTLLDSLGIAPHELPGRIEATGVADKDAWQQIWQQQQQQRLAEPPAAEERAQRALAQQAQPAQVQGWLSDWHAGGHGHAPAVHAQPPGIGGTWATEFSQSGHATEAAAQPGDAWAGEFAQQREAAGVAHPSESQAAAHHSAKLAQVLSSDPEDKFRDSKFLQFLSKMSQGQTDFAPPAATGSAWVDEFAANKADGWAAQFADAQAQAQAPAPAEAGLGWAQELGSGTGGVDAAEAWAEDFRQQQVTLCFWSTPLLRRLLDARDRRLAVQLFAVDASSRQRTIVALANGGAAIACAAQRSRHHPVVYTSRRTRHCSLAPTHSNLCRGSRSSWTPPGRLSATPRRSRSWALLRSTPLRRTTRTMATPTRCQRHWMRSTGAA